MNNIKYYTLIALLLVNPLHADFDLSAIFKNIDPSCIKGAIGGVATTLGVGVIYSLYSNDSEKKAAMKNIHDLNIAIEGYTLQYNDECKVVNSTNTDQTIETIASMLIHNNSSTENYIKKIEYHVTTLKKYLISAQELSQKISSDEHKQIAQSAQKNVKELIDNLQILYTNLQQDAPFIELIIAQRKEQDRYKEYESMVYNGSRFAHMDVVNRQNNDKQCITNLIQQANNLCQNKDCTPFKKILLSQGKGLLATIEKKQKELVNSNNFIKERKEFELFQEQQQKLKNEQLSLEIKYNQGLSEQKQHDIKLNEQRITQEKLRQYDEQLRQNDVVLKEGLYFEPQRKAYEEKIRQYKQEKHNWETYRSNVKSAIDRMERSVNSLENDVKIKETEFSNLSTLFDNLTEQANKDSAAFQHIKNLVTQLNEYLDTPPINPDSEKWFKDFFEKLRGCVDELLHNERISPPQSKPQAK